MTKPQCFEPIKLYIFDILQLKSKLNTLGDEEYPIARSLTHGEILELGEWVTTFFTSNAVQGDLDVQIRMFLETIEGRQERGVR